jgi:hypothetical protein
LSLAFIDARFEFNSVDLSTSCTSVTLPVEFEALEDTAMGDLGRSRIAGLQDSTIAFGLNQSFAASSVDATLWAALGTIVVIKVRPTSASISATNPEYVGSYLVTSYQPFGNSVGELAVVTLSLPLSDPTGIARNTS